MYAITKQRRIEVEIVLDEEDLEVKEKDTMEFDKGIKAILEGILKRPISHYGYKKPEPWWWGKDGKPKAAKIIAYYWWEPKAID